MKKNKRLAVYTNHVEKVSTEIDLPRIKFDSMLRIIFFWDQTKEAWFVNRKIPC